MRRGEEAKSAAYTVSAAEPLSFPLLSLASLHRGKKLLNLGIKPGKFQGEHRFSRVQDDVQRPGQLREPFPYYGPHTSTYTIPINGPAKSFTYRKSHPGTGRIFTVAKKQGHVTGEPLLPILVYGLKVCVFQEPRAF